MDKNISILEANIADNYLLIRILSRQIELHQSVCVLKERKSYDVIFFIISVDDNCGEWLHDWTAVGKAKTKIINNWNWWMPKNILAIWNQSLQKYVRSIMRTS